MITRKEYLLVRPFQHKNFVEHRKKIHEALPRIDAVTPPQRNHVQHKYKKIQAEAERHARIERENFILLEHLDTIMSKKRIDNRWLREQPKFLNRIKLFSGKQPRKSLDQLLNSCDEEKPKIQNRRCASCKSAYRGTEFVDDGTNVESIRKSLNEIFIESTKRPDANLRKYSGTYIKKIRERKIRDNFDEFVIQQRSPLTAVVRIPDKIYVTLRTRVE